MVNRAIILFWLGFILNLALSCSSASNKSSSSSKDTLLVKNSKDITISEDTLVEVNINDKPHKLKLSKYNVKDLQGVIQIYKKYKGKTLDSLSEINIDVTGDGIPEKVIIRTYFINNLCFTTRKILKNDPIIYNDTANGGPSGRLGEDYTSDDDKRFSFLEPYLSFYEGINFIPLIAEDIDISKAMKYESEEFAVIRYFEDSLKNQNLTNLEYNKKLKDFKKYLINYKGKFIQRIDGSGIYLYMWYEPWKKFIG